MSIPVNETQKGAYKEAVSVLEDAICQNSCLKLVLRLVCLTSLCSNGLYSTDYERLKKMFLQTYGFEHIVTFSLLLRTGLINIKVPLLILYYLLNVYILNRIATPIWALQA